jgi:hypothetical protein
MNTSSDDQGFILLSAVMIAAVLATIALGILATTRRLANDGARIVSDIELRAACESGLSRMIAIFSNTSDPLRKQLWPDGRAVSWRFEDTELTLRVQAESGKLDLNTGDRDHIAAVLNSAFKPAVAAAIMTKVDATRTNHSRIESVAAVLTPIDRMNRTRDALERLFTVMTAQRGVDPWSAPELILHTIPNISEDALQRIIDAKRGDQILPAGEFAEGIRSYFAAQRPIYTFRTEARSRQGRVGAMQALAGFDDRQRFHIYSWEIAGRYQ